jgi:hypothetical protein
MHGNEQENQYDDWFRRRKQDSHFHYRQLTLPDGDHEELSYEHLMPDLPAIGKKPEYF